MQRVKKADAYFVSEDLHSAVGTMDWFSCLILQVLIDVNDNVQRQALHSFLGGEFCAEAVDAKDNLWTNNQHD